MMNLIMAVIVEGVHENARRDRELRKQDMRREARYLLPQISAAFAQMDSDGSDDISLEEVSKSSIAKLPSDIRDMLDLDSMTDLFVMLDLDRSGLIKRDEFTEAVLTLALADVPKEVLEMVKLLQHQRAMSQKHFSTLQEQIEMLQTRAW